MKPKMDEDINQTHAGFRSETETRNLVFNPKLIIEKNRQCSCYIFLCFIDYSKASDMASNEFLSITMERMGFSSHIIDLNKNFIVNERQQGIATKRPSQVH